MAELTAPMIIVLECSWCEGTTLLANQKILPLDLSGEPNYAPVELIRRLRLQHGRTLLTQTDKTISEIAYETGFSTPAYFTKCYRDAYGETPSDLRNKLTK